MPDDFSRFRHTERITVNGLETYGRWMQPSFVSERPPDDQIKVFQVTSAMAGRPDLIANAIYGTPALDWVLIVFNNARDAINWPKAGELVEYPVDSVVIPNVL